MQRPVERKYIVYQRRREKCISSMLGVHRGSRNWQLAFEQIMEEERQALPLLTRSAPPLPPRPPRTVPHEHMAEAMSTVDHVPA